MMRWALFCFLALLAFCFPVLCASAADDIDTVFTLSRPVWACGGVFAFKEFRSAMLEGRKKVIAAYKKAGICLQLRAGTEIIVMDTLGGDSDVEGQLISFRRKGRYESLITEKWYGLSEPGKFSFVTGNTLREKKESSR